MGPGAARALPFQKSLPEMGPAGEDKGRAAEICSGPPELLKLRGRVGVGESLGLPDAGEPNKVGEGARPTLSLGRGCTQCPLSNSPVRGKAGRSQGLKEEAGRKGLLVC